MAYKSTVNTGLPNLPDPPDPAFFAEFTRVYNALRNLTVALDAYTGALPAEPQYYSSTPISTTVLSQNQHRVYVQFQEAASYGQIVNLYNNGGALGARLSNASAARPGHAWCSTAGGVLVGGWAEVMIGGLCLAFSGLTPGATYYLGNTAGSIAPTAGVLSQKMGYALGATQLFFRPDNI
jgi:hypothetical protein